MSVSEISVMEIWIQKRSEDIDYVHLKKSGEWGKSKNVLLFYSYYTLTIVLDFRTTFTFDKAQFLRMMNKLENGDGAFLVSFEMGYYKTLSLRNGVITLQSKMLGNM